ncbi:MAG: hypothetical protein N2445_08625, partial [Acidobacteria bacterium]|nr:hypothetical protein [Acidobacteriota bacterium]
MKKFYFVAIILLISYTLFGQTEKIEPGQIVYQAQKQGSNYRISLHALKPSSNAFDVKAIKVSYEPSGTVVLMIFDPECSEETKSDFKEGKVPLSVVETDISEIAPSVVIPFPNQIGKDNLIKIEYMINDGKVDKT